MTRLSHLMAIVKRHSIAWTYLLSGLIILASIWQPSEEHLIGGAVMAGLTGFFAALFRGNGLVKSFLAYGLGGAAAAAALAYAGLRYIFPLFGAVADLGWDHWPALAAIALTGLIVAYIYRPHHQPAAVAVATTGDVAKTADAAADTPADASAPANAPAAAPAAAPAPVAHSPHRFRYAAVWVSLCVLFVGWFTVANNWEVFREGQMNNAKPSEVLTAQPETRLDHNRQFPKEAAYEALAHGGLDTNVDTGAPQLIATPSCAIWQAARYDTSTRGQFFDSVEDIVQTDACSPNSQLIQHPGPKAAFIYGDRSWVVTSAFTVHHAGATMGRKIYWQRPDTTWVLLISVIRTHPTLALTMVPDMTGVMVVHQNGTMENLDLTQVAEQYPGAPLYPLELMRRYAQSRGLFRGGWDDVAFCVLNCNKMVAVISEDQNNDPNSNQAPYIQDLQEIGQQGMIALEPKGQDLVAEWLYFDITTGKLRSWVPDRKMFSPKVAAREAKKADPSMDQTHRRVVEPKPITIKNASGVLKTFYNDAVISDDPNNASVHSFVESIVVDADNKAAKKIEFGHFDEWVQSVRDSK